MRKHYDFSKARRGAVAPPTDSKIHAVDRGEELPVENTDAEDLAAFEERADEPIISYEELMKERKADGKL